MPESRCRPDSCASLPPFWVSVELVVKPSASETLFSDVLLLLPTTRDTMRRELRLLLLFLLLGLVLVLVLVLSRARPVVPATAGTPETAHTPAAPAVGGAMTTKAIEGRHTKSAIMMASFSRVTPASGSSLSVADGPTTPIFLPILLFNAILLLCLLLPAAAPSPPRTNPTRSCCHFEERTRNERVHKYRQQYQGMLLGVCVRMCVTQ